MGPACPRPSAGREQRHQDLRARGVLLSPFSQIRTDATGAQGGDLPALWPKMPAFPWVPECPEHGVGHECQLSGPPHVHVMLPAPDPDSAEGIRPESLEGTQPGGQGRVGVTQHSGGCHGSCVARGARRVPCLCPPAEWVRQAQLNSQVGLEASAHFPPFRWSRQGNAAVSPRQPRSPCPLLRPSLSHRAG